MEQPTGHRYQGRTQQRIDTLTEMAQSLQTAEQARTEEEIHIALMIFYSTQRTSILETIHPQAEAREDYEAARAILEILCERCVNNLIQEIDGE